MNINDLLHGDWIKEKNGNRPVEIVFTRNIDKDSRQVLYGDDDRIEPLPLTAEILKHIGFKKVQPVDSDDMARDYFLNIEGSEYLLHYIEGSRGRNGELQASIFSPDDIELHRWIAPVNYVHELQHALRLFHIDLEVKL